MNGVVRRMRRSRIFSNVVAGLRTILSDRATKLYLSILIIIIFMGMFGPHFAPYEHDEIIRGDDGEILRTDSPSLSHPLGTTDSGHDVFSRILVGARPTVFAGLLGGGLIISIGLTIGMTAGYLGGKVDDVLMRITDIAYGVPVIPFALVLAAFFDFGFITSIVIIGALLWRGSARVIRAQVLQIKERPFILASKATGASSRRIITTHIFPNIASMAVLFFALGIGWTIIIQAGLAFIGAADPFVPSWGVMVRNAYRSGYMDAAWWWSLSSGLLISITVIATFMFGRSYEQLTNPDGEYSARMG